MGNKGHERWLIVVEIKRGRVMRRGICEILGLESNEEKVREWKKDGL